jgi:hypothetical protein
LFAPWGLAQPGQRSAECPATKTKQQTTTKYLAAWRFQESD